MLKIAICDDNSDFLAQINRIINQWEHKPNPFIVRCFEDGDALICAHNEAPFDIILLDVVLPFLNGIEIAQEIREYDKSVKIVFLTSSPEFAVDSYTVKANNYLLKPIESARLFHCLDELKEDIQHTSQSIIVKSIHAVHRIALANIEYIESQNKHNLFVLSNGEIIESVEPLYTYEDKLMLSDGFFKCHRGYIVNIHHIDTYTLREIKTRSGCRIPISRKYHRDFETAYFSVIFGKAGEDT